MESIIVTVVNADGSEQALEIPTGVSLSLMEVLKGEGYPIEATCGGMALCATCRVNILNLEELDLPEASDDELYILDTLPDCGGSCRLSCQLPIRENLNGAKLSLPQEVAVA